MDVAPPSANSDMAASTRIGSDRAADNAVLGELKAIHGTLDSISHKVNAWAVENNIDQPEKSAQEKGSLRSRMIAATGMSLLGWKAGAILGGKVGFFTGAIRDRFAAFRGLTDVTSLSDLWKMFKAAYFPETILGAGIGSVLGILAGAGLGFARGDRIKNPKDFFAHPLKSFSTLVFGEEERRQPENNTPATRELSGDENIKQQNAAAWQTRMQSAPVAAVQQR